MDIKASKQVIAKRRRGLKPLSSCVEKAIKPALKQRGFAESRILTDWPLIVGDALAAQTSVQRIRFAKGAQTDGVLYVEVYHSGLAMELVYLAPMLLEKIATYFGYKAITQIKWVQRPGYKKKQLPKLTPVAEPSAEAKKYVSSLVGEVSDDTLKAALSSLGNHLLGKMGK